MKKITLLLFIALTTQLFASAQQFAVLETTQGTIKIQLYPEVAPLAVENFVTHIRNGYYNGLIFHRIIKDFMIQGGDPTGTGRGGESIWKKPFKDEFTKETFNKAGILAMANAGKNTNGSQFFITTSPTPWLNGYHTIFGRITKESFKTLQKLNNIKTLDNRLGNRPIKEQKIIKAYMEK